MAVVKNTKPNRTNLLNFIAYDPKTARHPRHIYLVKKSLYFIQTINSGASVLKFVLMDLLQAEAFIVISGFLRSFVIVIQTQLLM